MEIKIVLDSGSDILESLAKEKGIEVVPLKVSFGDKTYTDGVDMDRDLFYETMAKSEHVPKTTLPSPQDFIDVFTRIGKDVKILCITISAETSGTYGSAKLAKESLPDYDITLFDSKNISAANITLALSALNMIHEGASMEEIVDSLNEIKGTLFTFIAIKDLTNVVKGGRISNWKGQVARILNIKPILHLTRDGHIHVKENIRGRKKQLSKVLDLITDTGKDIKGRIFYMLHAMADQEELDYLSKAIKERFEPLEIVIYRLGPIMGSHGGFGTIGFSF